MHSMATFAAGCFWGVEATFEKIPGVLKTTVGYTGGTFLNPTYKDVCKHTTGHAEAVQVEFDPERISYETLLDHFWKCHDPTSYHAQGADLGSQYRSAIFCHTVEHLEIATQSKEQLEQSGYYKKPIVTEIQWIDIFWPAEEYHQHYYKKNGLDACSS